MNLISVILPVYNGELYLEEAIKSVLNQTYPNFELIIVNDASTDESSRIANSYAQHDNRIIVINNATNKKLPVSLNRGHDVARGRYITWLSHDNTLKINFLQSFTSIIQTTGGRYDIYFSDYDLISETSKIIKTKKSGPVSKLILGNFIGASFLYKRKVYLQLHSYDKDLFLAEDHDFFLRASLYFKFLKIDEVLYNYRIHSKSLTSSISRDVAINQKLLKSLDGMYSKKDFRLDGVTKKFLIAMRTGKASIKDYLTNREIIRKDLHSFQKRAFGKEMEEIELDILIYWYFQVKEHRLGLFLNVLYQAPELIRSNFKIAGRIFLNCFKLKFSNSTLSF